MDWLKTILGDSYTEDIDKQIADQVGKRFVSREDFNETNETRKQLAAQVKQHEKQLEDLQKRTAGDNELQSQIAALQAQNDAMAQEHARQLQMVKMQSAVEKTLMGANAKNLTAAKALLADFLETAEMDEQGQVKGLSEAVAALQQSEETGFLFQNEQPKTSISGATPANPDKVAPGGKSVQDMSYEELCAHLENNPEALP